MLVCSKMALNLGDIIFKEFILKFKYELEKKISILV